MIILTYGDRKVYHDCMNELILYTVSEAAEVLKVSERTIHRYISSGLLPSVRVGPKKVRIKHEELMSLLKERKEEAELRDLQKDRIERGRRRRTQLIKERAKAEKSPQDAG